jgi:hypothetical protein
VQKGLGRAEALQKGTFYDENVNSLCNMDESRIVLEYDVLWVVRQKS